MARGYVLLDDALSAADSTTTGVDTIPSLTSGDLTRTVLPFLTPEMYGAVGDGVADDGAEMQTAINAAIAANVPFHARGSYFSSVPLEIYASGSVEYWDESTALRPPTVFINKLRTSSTDAAVKILGKGAVPARVTINDLSGPGMDAGALGTPGEGDETIGVQIQGFVFATIRSVQDFNYGVVMQEAFCADVEIGFVFACYQSLWTRLNPDNSSGTNQEVTIRAQSIGGIFTGPGGVGDVYRRTRGAKLGAKLEYLSGSQVNIGIGYCQLDDTSKFIEVDENCFGNVLHLYMEGVRADGTFGEIEGNDNTIYLAGLGTPSDVKDGRLVISGVGNRIFGIPNRGTDAARAFGVADQSAPVIQINPGNHVEGSFKVEELRSASTLNHCLVSSATTWTFAGSGSVDAAASGAPTFLEDTTCFRITASGSGAVNYTSQSISISGETRDRLKILTAIKV